MFATFITLLMVPCLYLILEDLKKAGRGFFRFLGFTIQRRPAIEGPTAGS